jgi:hypothetical protein
MTKKSLTDKEKNEKMRNVLVAIQDMSVECDESGELLLGPNEFKREVLEMVSRVYLETM